MNNNSKKHSKVLIIGSGPAGYTAAVYAARAMLKPMLVHGIEPGGQLSTTTDVENYPGFAKVIQGPWLMDQMRDQAKAVGTEMIEDHIASVNLKSKPFEAVGDGGQKYTADSIIISTGAQARWLNIESEQKFRGFGVSACATCDGFFFKDKTVAVVGGGNAAVEEAMFLTKFASKVKLIHRRNALRAEKMLQEKLFEKTGENGNIKILWDHVLDEVLGDESGVNGIVCSNVNEPSDQTQLDVQGVFIAIGHDPNTSFFGDGLKLDDSNYIILDESNARFSTQTSIEGVFAAGDVADPVYRQAVTSAGSGCMAALDAEKFLEQS